MGKGRGKERWVKYGGQEGGMGLASSRLCSYMLCSHPPYVNILGVLLSLVNGLMATAPCSEVRFLPRLKARLTLNFCGYV